MTDLFIRRAVSVGTLGASLLLFGCGGGGGDSGGGSPPAATSVDVPITVVDGLIQNANVCLDKNSNGTCESDEPSGKTDTSGKVTLKVDVADAGKYPVIAVVGTDAIDADTGAVPVAFTLKAPADKPNVISPLTTLVQSAMLSKGMNSTDAESYVKKQMGLKVSLFDDFVKGATVDHKTAATVARMVVVTTQLQFTALASAVGETAKDGAKITKTDVDKVVQKHLLEILSDFLPSVNNLKEFSITAKDNVEKALLAQSNMLVNDSDLTLDNLPTIIAKDRDASSPSNKDKTVTISGIVSVSPINGANVTAFSVVNGEKKAPLATVKTDANGKYSLTLSTSKEPVIVEASGGSYTDPASGEVVPLDTVLRSVTASAEKDTFVSITIYSEVVVRLAEAKGGLTQTNVVTAKDLVTQQIGFDPIRTRPVNGLMTDSTSWTANGLTYSTLNGTAAQYKNESEISLPLLLDNFSTLFQTEQFNVTPYVISSVNNYGANSRNVNEVLTARNTSAGTMATCSNAQSCFGPSFLPRCPTKPVITCNNKAQKPVNGVCKTTPTPTPTPTPPTCTAPKVIQNGVCITPYSLTGTWVGTWSWKGYSPKNPECLYNDGGAISITLRQNGVIVDGTTNYAEGIQRRSDDGTCKLTSTSRGTGGGITGDARGINDTTGTLSFTDLGIDTLTFTGSMQLNGNKLTGTISRTGSVGAQSGTLSLTRQ